MVKCITCGAWYYPGDYCAACDLAKEHLNETMEEYNTINDIKWAISNCLRLADVRKVKTDKSGADGCPL